MRISSPRKGFFAVLPVSGQNRVHWEVRGEVIS